MIAIVDYRAGNLTSVRLAFEALRTPAIVARSPAALLSAERVVFPGVGAAGAAMANLRRLGLAEPLRETARRGTPFLGICLGAQALFDFPGGGWRSAGPGPPARHGQKFAPADRRDRVQIGWECRPLARPTRFAPGSRAAANFTLSIVITSSPPGRKTPWAQPIMPA